MKPIRVDLNVIVGKCDDCSACLANAPVTCDREALPLFKYVTKTPGPSACNLFDCFSRLVGRVIVDDHYLPSDRFGHDLNGNVSENCE